MSKNKSNREMRFNVKINILVMDVYKYLVKNIVNEYHNMVEFNCEIYIHSEWLCIKRQYATSS